MSKIIYDMSNADYHASSAVSRSGLALIGEAPRKFWWKYLSGQVDETETNAMRIGTIFHTMVLEPDTFKDRVLIWSGAPRNTKAGKEEYEAAQEACGNRLLCKQSEFNDMQRMVDAVKSEPAAKKIITGAGKIEASIFWSDTETGRQVKCRPDYLKDDGLILDVKTVASAAADDFEKSIVNYAYDVQAYICMEGARRVGIDAKAFVFMCVEKEPPHCTAFYVADETVLQSGAARYRKWMDIYNKCMETNTFPAYGSLIQPIGVPSWFIKKMESENV